MRSRTENDLPGRCKRCWLRDGYCLCAEVPTVPTRFEILVLRHLYESWKSTNTARIAKLALPALQIVDYTPEERAIPSAATEEGSWLLFPGGEPRWDEARPKRLVVIDGTWAQVRKLLNKTPALAALPRLSIDTAPLPVRRLRQTTVEGGRSTLEAITAAIRRLEGEDAARPLEQLHATLVERTLRARGTW